MRPRVDVVIPCYNYAHYLPESVSSVLSQDGVDVRVLVIDDCSPDNTAEVATDLAGRDSRVAFVRHPANRGHIRSYNEGIDWISGDYWLMLSADDVVAPGAFRRATAIMDAHPDVGLAYGRALRGATVTAFPAFGDQRECVLMAGTDFLRYVCQTARNPVPTPTAVVRTAVQKSVGGYRAELPHSGDLEMWMRIAAHADVVALKACQGLYRWHGHNMQWQYLRPVMDDLAEMWRAFDIVFSTYGARIRGADEMRATVSRVIADDAFWRGSKAFDAGDANRLAECLAFAAACCPAITESPAWRRMKVKAALGPRAWSWLRPIVDGARPAAPPAAEPDLKDPNLRDVIGNWSPVGRRALLDAA